MGMTNNRHTEHGYLLNVEGYPNSKQKVTLKNRTQDTCTGSRKTKRDYPQPPRAGEHMYLMAWRGEDPAGVSALPICQLGCFVFTSRIEHSLPCGIAGPREVRALKNPFAFPAACGAKQGAYSRVYL